MSGSGISWAICKSAPRSRQITMPAPHHSVFYRPDALSVAQQRQSTEGNFLTVSIRSLYFVVVAKDSCCYSTKCHLAIFWLISFQASGDFVVSDSQISRLSHLCKFSERPYCYCLIASIRPFLNPMKIKNRLKLSNTKEVRRCLKESQRYSQSRRSLLLLSFCTVMFVLFYCCYVFMSLHCFDAVGWAAGRASGL